MQGLQTFRHLRCSKLWSALAEFAVRRTATALWVHKSTQIGSAQNPKRRRRFCSAAALQNKCASLAPKLALGEASGAPGANRSLGT